MSANAEPMFDTHAHVISDDWSTYPPSAAGREQRLQAYRSQDLIADMNNAGVATACVVQRFHVYGYDNSYALDASREVPDRLTPVIMLDGLDPESPGRLRELAKRQSVGGLRFANPSPKIHDTAWMNAPQTMRLWEVAAELGLPVTLMFFLHQLPYNLPALGFVAELFPKLPIVIDHMGVPCGPVAYLHVIGAGKPLPYPGPPDYGFSQALRDLRRVPNIFFKLTGLNLEYLEHNKVDACGFVRRFVEEFGADRVMCGTDIGQTIGPYDRIVSGLRKSLSLLNSEERHDVLFNTADKVYGIPGLAVTHP